MTAFVIVFLLFGCGDMVCSMANPGTSDAGGLHHGALAGAKEGAIAGEWDYYAGNQRGDIFAALTDYDIIVKFNLHREEHDYRVHFIKGYKEEYKKAYEGVFGERKAGEFREKNRLPETAVFVAMAEDILCVVTIPSESVYYPVRAELTALNSEGVYENGIGEYHVDEYRIDQKAAEMDEKAVDMDENTADDEQGKYPFPVFQIRLSHDSGDALLRKPIEITFDFKGSEDVKNTKNLGIYEWRNHKWVYLPTEIFDGGIRTVIPPGRFGVEKYAVLIDKDSYPLDDILFNWAEPEISAFFRRGYFSKDQHFMPNDEMTRLDVALLLYRILRGQHPFVKEDSMQPKSPLADRKSFGAAADAIDFVINNGLMVAKGNQFLPNEGFRYEDLEQLASSLNIEGFNWDEVAKTIMKERFYKSLGYQNPSGKMTRAEMSYFLFNHVDK